MFAIGWLAAAKGKRSGLLAAGCALSLLLLKSVLTWKPVWEAVLFPWPAYIYLQEYWLYLIGLWFFGISIPQLSVRWNQYVVGAVAAAVLLAGLESTWWMVHPEIHGEARTATSDHHYRQTTFYTCAPSSCVSALSYAGVATTEREMANLCLTHDSGTSVFNIYRGLTMKLAGTSWRCSVVNRTVDQLMVSGMIAVITELPGYHAIAIHGQGTSLEVQDPMLLKPVQWTPAQLHDHMDGMVAVIIEPVSTPVQ